MKNDYYLQEQIEAYLNGQLPEVEQLAFKDKLQKDPLLKQEVEFQEDIMNALQQYRKVQLKSRLQNIEVAPVNNTGFLRLRWGAIAAGIVVVATSGLYFYKQATAPTLLEPVTIEIPASPKLTQPGPDSQATPAQQAEKQLPLARQTMPEIDKKKAEAVKPAPKPDRSAVAEEMPAIDRNFEQAVQPDNGLNINKEIEMTIPDGQIASGAAAALATTVDVKLMESKEYSYHYQYYNNKLFLYGNFNNKPYKLLEINSMESRSLYMYHDSAFYLLENNKLEPTPLVEITNKELKEELKQKLQSK